MRYSGVSIILPTIRETTSFVKAVEVVLENVAPADICEFIAVVCEKTNPESFEYIDAGKKLAESAGVDFSVLHQQLPGFGGAMIDAFMAARGSHCVLVTPDLNTAPEKLPDMIGLAKKYPGSVISLSRWLKGGGFVNYDPVKKVWNWLSQKFLEVFYLSGLTDFTFGVHMAPTVLYQSIAFCEMKHPINLEQVVVPLRLGVKFYEVAAVSRAEEEDVTVNPLAANFAYLRPAFHWRFAKREKMLRSGVDYKELMQKLNEREEQA